MSSTRNTEQDDTQTRSIGNLTDKEIKSQLYHSFGIIVDERQAISFAAWIIHASGSQLPLVPVPGDPKMQKLFKELGLN
jgi:hypothetical protein